MISDDRDRNFQRRLAGVLAADVVGFTALVESDEEAAIRAVQALWKNIVEPASRQLTGRIVKKMGDGILLEFSSATNAVQCAVNIQETLAAGGSAFPDGIDIALRIGAHLGDVIIDDDDILGDGVNLAARLESLCTPGGICISAAIRDQLRKDLAEQFNDVGERHIKNMSRPVRVFAFQETQTDAIAQPAGAVNVRKPTVALDTFASLPNGGDALLLAESCQQTTAALLSCQTGLMLTSADGDPDYIVTANLQTSGPRYRCLLTMQCREQQAQVLNKRLDGQTDDVFDLQDQISGHIATAVRYAILSNESAKAAASENATPEQKLSRAGQLLMGGKPPDWEEAGRLIDDFLSERPDDFMALAMKACQLLWDVSIGVRRVSDEKARLAHALLQQALELNQNSDFLHFVRTQYAYGVEQDREAALRAIDRSFEINPEYVLAKLSKGVVLAMDERSQEALALCKMIAPEFSQNAGYFRIVGVRSLSHLVAENYHEAANAATEALERWSNFPMGHLLLAASTAQMGDLATARKGVSGLLSLDPNLTVQDLRPLQFDNDQHWEALCRGLASAGLPETES